MRGDKTTHTANPGKGVSETERINHRINTLQKLRSEYQTELARLKKATTGYVYFVRSQDGLWKIGCSQNVPKRMAQLRTSNAAEIELVHTVKSDDMHQAEKCFHNQFAAWRKHREWFDLDTAQRDWPVGTGFAFEFDDLPFDILDEISAVQHNLEALEVELNQQESCGAEGGLTPCQGS